jgi:hypothetical protein
MKDITKISKSTKLNRSCYNKIPYLTKNEALTTIRRGKKRKNENAYSCKLTGKTHYHITSMPKGNYKQKMNKEKIHSERILL